MFLWSELVEFTSPCTVLFQFKMDISWEQLFSNHWYIGILSSSSYKILPAEYWCPFILGVTSNLVVNSSWFNPLYIDTGSYDITIFSNSSSLIPPVNRQYYKFTSSFRNRIICSERITDDFKLDINSLDLSGNAVNVCAGFLECRIPFYFENV